jgi:hypothetical protein
VDLSDRAGSDRLDRNAVEDGGEVGAVGAFQEIYDNRWIEDTEHAGNRMVAIAVSDVGEEIAALEARGLATGLIE